jgi:Domain of unknown function (DUF4166)
VASILGLPESGQAVSVSLEVVVEGQRERWRRTFGDHRLETIQWAAGDHLMESFGPFVFSSVLLLDGPRLCYQFDRAWFVGLPVPCWASPTVAGSVIAGESGWWVANRVLAPFFGEIVRYEGWVELE